MNPKSAISRIIWIWAFLFISGSNARASAEPQTDIDYNQWLELYLKKEGKRLTAMDRRVAFYQQQILRMVAEGDSENKIGEWRDLQFKSGAYTMPLTLIQARKTNDLFTFNPLTDVKEGRLNLERIRSLRLAGDVTALFFQNDRLYAVAKASSQPPGIAAENRFPEDIAVLLRGIFLSPSHSIWQTIAPPLESDQPKLSGRVRFGGMVENTHVGAVLFEADRIMKCLATGQDNRQPGKFEKKEWFKSLSDFVPESEFQNWLQSLAEWFQFWYTIEDVEVGGDQNSKGVCLDRFSISIKTDWGLGANELWARHFQIHFSDYAKIYTVLAEFNELARWAALLLALENCGILFRDMKLDSRPRVKTATQTPFIAVKSDLSSEIETKDKSGSLTVTGGVLLRSVKMEKADLGVLIETWLKQYGQGNLLVERIF